MNRAIFVDRDGTLIEEVNFLSKPSQVRWIPGVLERLAQLYRQGWQIIMVTNQSGVARGLFTLEDVQAVYAFMQSQLEEYGGRFQAMYCCPHHPQFSLTEAERHCSCRKPQPGMYLQAQKDWDLDLKRCVAFGDKLSDLQGPLQLGCRAFLVGTGYGAAERLQIDPARYPQLEFCSDLSAGLELLLPAPEPLLKHSSP